MLGACSLPVKREQDETSRKYGKTDGIIAIVFFLYDVFDIYFWRITPAGQWLRNSMASNLYDYLLLKFASFFEIQSAVQAAKDWARLISALPADFIPVAVIFIILAVKKQKISSLGFRKHHNLKASLIGIAAGILTALLMDCILFFCGKPNVFHSLSKLRLSVFALLSNIVFTGLTEELSFRAFLQSRIAGVIRNKWAAVLTVGLMFWASHFINDYLGGSTTAANFLLQGVFMVCIHILFLFLYRKTDNILAAVFCHGIYDFMIAPIYF